MVEPEKMGTPLYFEDFCKSIFPKDKEELVIIEVGTWKGASAFNMISAADKKCKVYCVDTWLGSHEHYDTIQRDENGYPCIFRDFWNNVKSMNYENIITPITLPSVDGSKLLEKMGVKADVIYIDAAHDYKNSKADLDVYWPLLKEGGIFMGDDFSVDWYGVIGAVQQFSFEVGTPFKVVNNKTWYMTKKSQ